MRQNETNALREELRTLVESAKKLVADLKQEKAKLERTYLLLKEDYERRKLRN